MNKIFFRETNFETIVLGVIPRPTVNFIKIGNGDRDLVFDLIWTHPLTFLFCGRHVTGKLVDVVLDQH